MDEQIIQSLIGDLALILVLGAIATVIFKKLKQPVVLGYIVAGFLASPHFDMFPSVVSEANIEFWAQIGIIVLLFSLGLEFSFKKLLNVGAPAFITAGIIVLGMLGLGFFVGKLLGDGLVNSLFMGGMLSMSSTTIILKALTDLNMRQRRFVPMIFAVLIVEDLIAVVLMVVLSSVAVNKTVEGGQMLHSILKLSFFLVIWFVVGIFIIPSVFKKFKKLISDEMMLIISMGLCFLMAIFSVKSGFSLALGAFVMGSILAGTVEARRIERIVSPIKDLFGAVFFISVGMMVDPTVIVEHAGIIAVLALVVIVGMIIFGTFGMLATGQSLKNAVQSGFALTQIGEFSFIIASMGTSLGVLHGSTYPIIVAVSVITTFTTPFFIKKSDGAYKALVHILPKRWVTALGGYSKTAVRGDVPESREIWKGVTQRYLLRVVLYSAVTIGIVMISSRFLWPVMDQGLAEHWDQFLWVAVTLALVLPFLFAIVMPPIRHGERTRLVELEGRVSYVPLVIMEIISFIIGITFIVLLLREVYYGWKSLFASLITILVIMAAFTPFLRRHMSRLERQFIGNVNVRENRRTGRNNTLVSDMHLAYMVVGRGCRFAGDTLMRADLRRKYGVNVANIERAGRLYPVPNGDMRIFPGDTLGVIGTEAQIERLLPLVEAEETDVAASAGEAKFARYALTTKSDLIGRTLKEARLREDHGTLLVSIQRTDTDGNDHYLPPTPDVMFLEGDVLWLVGDPAAIKPLL